MARFLVDPSVLRKSPSFDELRMAFRLKATRRLRKTDCSISIEGARFEVPVTYRHWDCIGVHYARWDLSFVHMADLKTDKSLLQIYPSALGANASSIRRTIDNAQSGAVSADIGDRNEMAPLAATKKDAEKAFSIFINVFKAKYPKATDCLEKDREALLAFYSFPAEHWKHIRTTNPIESTFATIRLRTKRTKGHGSAEAALTMAFKLAQCAEKKWKRLDKPGLLAEVINIKVKFVDGVKRKAA